MEPERRGSLLSETSKKRPAFIVHQALPGATLLVIFLPPRSYFGQSPLMWGFQIWPSKRTRRSRHCSRQSVCGIEGERRYRCCARPKRDQRGQPGAAGCMERKEEQVLRKLLKKFGPSFVLLSCVVCTPSVKISSCVVSHPQNDKTSHVIASTA